MSFPKIVVIPIQFSPEPPEVLHEVKRMSFLEGSEIHFIHIYHLDILSEELQYSYKPPFADQEVRTAIENKLKDMTKDILPSGFQGKLIYTCLFSVSPKETLAEYINDIRADLTVVCTRMKKGIFENSYSKYLSYQANSDILILRPKARECFKGPVKVIYGISFESDQRNYASLKNYNFLSRSQLELLHFVRVQNFNPLQALSHYVFPSSDSKIVIEDAINHELEKIMPHILPENFTGSCHVKTLFASDMKDSFYHYLHSEKADILVLRPLKKKMFGSMISYMVAKSPCNVLLIKNRTTE